MQIEKLTGLINQTLDNLKATDICNLDVSGLTPITDMMIIASGESQRQVKALAEQVIMAAKKQKIQPLGIEGEQYGEWVLVDLGDVIVHLMHPTVRAYYQLEKLWSVAEDEQRELPKDAKGF